MHDEGATSFNRHQGADRGECPAGTVSADGDALGIDFKFRGVIRNPNERLIAIVDGCRKLMLRSESVADRDDGAVGLVRDRPTYRVMGVETARDISATMKIDECWRDRSTRPIDANRERTA